jgi:LacI family gluconate utilization system Gnt-I transcriptional repressor
MECHRHGWSVPGRVAIAGFGDFEVARCSFPRITTVSVDAFEIGRAAGDLMLRAIEASRGGRRIPPELMLMPFKVIQREST